MLVPQFEPEHYLTEIHAIANSSDTFPIEFDASTSIDEIKKEKQEYMVRLNALSTDLYVKMVKLRDYMASFTNQKGILKAIEKTA